MKLMTKAIEKKIPALYGTENIPTEDKICQVKFFNPCGSWTWYAVEFDPDEGIFFGLVHGHEKEWGYFTLEELQSVRLPFGLGIERDLNFGPVPMSKVINGEVS